MNDYTQPFAMQLKLIAYSLIENKIDNNIDTDFDKLTIVNDYKDNKPNIKVLGQYNMREVLQILGSEFFRNIEGLENIHVVFTAINIYENIDKNNFFIIDDLRFPNELEFIKNFNLFNNDINKVKSFLINYIHTLNTIPDNAKIKKHFFKIFNLTNKNIDNTPAQILLERILNSFDKIRIFKSSYPNNDLIFNNINSSDNNLSWLQYFSTHNVLKVFRPLLPLELKDSTNIDKVNKLNNNLRHLISEIHEFTGIDKKEIENIRNIYVNNNIIFSVENIHKYGYIRANPNHISETSLREHIPLFTNLPKHLSSEADLKLLEKELRNIFSDIQDTKIYLFGISGPAGSGKGFISDIIYKIFTEQLKKNNKHISLNN